MHHYFESLAVEFAYSEMDKRRRLLLRSVIQLIQDWNEPKDYGGLRWRPILHARLQAWCHTIRRKRADDGHDATSRNSRKHRERAVFEKLINLLDTRGFAVFGQDLLIPVGNLIMRERKELP